MNTSDEADDDRLIIENLRMPALVGVHPHEKGGTQPVCLSLEIGLPNRDRHASDALEDTICYMAVADAVRAIATSRHFNLVETLAEAIAQELLGRGAPWARVRVGKPGIVDGAQAVDVAIIRRRPRLQPVQPIQPAAFLPVATAAH